MPNDPSSKIDDHLLNAAIAEAAFLLPAGLMPSAWVGHMPFLTVLVQLMEPRNYVELGVQYGGSFIAAATAVKTYSPNTVCHGIDSWNGDLHSDFYDGTEMFSNLEEFLKNYLPSAQLHRSLFDDAAPKFDDESIDLLHIDGFHTYDAVVNDFDTWLPKMSDTGVILFHDTFVRERGFGVWKFWMELSQRYPAFEFYHSAGLGVLFTGREPTPKLRYLIEKLTQDPGYAELFRAMCERTGAVLSDRFHHNNLKREMDSKNAKGNDNNA